MLAAFTLILVCQIAGEALVRGAGLPLPGPVIGMLLLFLSCACACRSHRS
jgi:holin-like protein